MIDSIYIVGQTERYIMGFIIYVLTALAIQLLLGLFTGPNDIWSLKWWMLTLGSLSIGAVLNIFYAMLRDILYQLKLANIQKR